MSTHGRGGLARIVLGSVAAEVVRRSAIPLVVVPPDIR
jgi:nucleotide-binding universal stress UspA family protein